MKNILLSCLCIVLCVISEGQNVQINVKVLSNRIPISPFIYGRNNSLSDDPGSPVSATNWQLYTDAGLRFFRENGGNDLSKYNWRLKLTSHPDWYNNVYASDWDYAAQSLQQHISGAQGMWGFQLIGQARCRLRHAGIETTADLTGQPGLPLRATADHDGVGARAVESSNGLVE